MSGQTKRMAFTLNAFKRQKLEKKKKKEEEEQKATAAAYEQFVASFEEDSSTKGKLFVRGTVINVGSGEEKSTEQTGSLYIPSKMGEFPPKREAPEQPSFKPPKIDKPPGKKKDQERKKSNLELFTEELKVMQEGREERHRMKKSVNGLDNGLLFDDYRSVSSFQDDPTTTNIYLGNLNPEMSKKELCQLFGQFGPLASIKIMWPRSEEERQRGKNFGFVAYMTRKDAEKAMQTLTKKKIMGYEMKMGWGKSLTIPAYPYYIPPHLQELTQPPPPSGLPFNAQPDQFYTEEEMAENMDEILRHAVVKVVIPTDSHLLGLIHRMVEFVVREGPLFEAMIMNQEINNPLFSFLYDNQTPAHTYYRWRLYSILQGEDPKHWREKEFRMFVDGSIWRPPPIDPFSMERTDEVLEALRKEMPQRARDELEDLLHDLTPEKSKIADAMMFCLKHAKWSEEVVQCITESLTIPSTSLYRKIARLYLVSDILHNASSCTATHAASYTKWFEAKLPEIFSGLHLTFRKIEGKTTAQQFKQRVVTVLTAWLDWELYPEEFLVQLLDIFLRDSLHGLDGLPLMSEEVDGLPLQEGSPEIDGLPLGEESEAFPISQEEEEAPPSSPEEEEPPLVVPSKWETAEREKVVVPPVTSSKWDMLDEEEEGELPVKPKEPAALNNVSESSLDATSSNSDFSEERRAKLREIEVKVVRFQDELESGKRSRKAGMTIPDQVEHYRKKLLRKEKERLLQAQEELERKAAQPSPPSPGEASPVLHAKESPFFRKRSRSPRTSKSHRSNHLSPKRYSHRSRSRSPKRRRSRSPGYRRSPPRKSYKSRKSKY